MTNKITLKHDKNMVEFSLRELYYLYDLCFKEQKEGCYRGKKEVYYERQYNVMKKLEDLMTINRKK